MSPLKETQSSGRDVPIGLEGVNCHDIMAEESHDRKWQMASRS